jgi:exonuclease SbcD
VYDQLGQRLTELVELWLSEKIDPSLPVILTAHCTVQGAVYGGERNVMLGNDLVLPSSMVKDSRLAYVALGHIHKPQDLNHGQQPPVIYPGSVERVDFGEAGDDKFFVIAHVEHGKDTDAEWRKLEGVRPFVDRYVRLEGKESITDCLRDALAPRTALQGAVVRLVVEYPREWEAMIDEAALREYAAESFEFFLVRRPQTEARIRLPGDVSVGSLTPLELLSQYWSVSHTDAREWEALQEMAAQVIHEVGG